jgi:hypothetical protein
MTEPRDLTDLVPNHVRADLAVAVAVLEQYGPAVTDALRQLDQATTAARQVLSPVEPTEDEGGWSSTRPASTVAGMRPTGWCRRSSRPGRIALRRNA